MSGIPVVSHLSDKIGDRINNPYRLASVFKKNKIDEIGLKLNMFVEYHKFKNAFRCLFNSFLMH